MSLENKATTNADYMSSKLNWLMTQLEEVQTEYNELEDLLTEIEIQSEYSGEWVLCLVQQDLKWIGEKIGIFNAQITQLVGCFVKSYVRL